MNECEDCDRLDCRERGCIAPRTYEDEIKRQALESSGLALWSAYCDKKMDLEDALDRIEALEDALRLMLEADDYWLRGNKENQWAHMMANARSVAKNLLRDKQ